MIPISETRTFDCYHDSLTHHYLASVFYDALAREISFAKREGNQVGIIKFQLLDGTAEDQMLFFANELELAVRQHDLISRISDREFAVLLRLDTEVNGAFEALISRLIKMENREFLFGCVRTDGTKGLAKVLEELDNPQILCSSKTL